MDEFMLEILGAIENTANERLPLHNSKVGNRCKHAIPRWNHETKPFKENAHCWHSIWQSAGRPLRTPFTREENYEICIIFVYTQNTKCCI